MASVGAIHSVTSTVPVRQAEYKPKVNAANERELKVDAAREVPGAQPLVTDDKDEKKTGDRSEELENLASVSEDGDTVQVSPESNGRLELDKFGKMTVVEQSKQDTAAEVEKKEEEKKLEERKAEAKEELKETMKKAEKKAAELKDFDLKKTDDKKADQKAQAFDDRQDLITQPVSTVGRTETQIKEMYLQGDISKNEYDRAIEIREERKDTVQENDEQFAQDTARVSRQVNQVKQDAVEIKELYAPEASDAIAAGTRAEILSSLQDFAIKDN